MGKQDTEKANDTRDMQETNSSILDVFEIDHSKYRDQENVEEVVKEGHGDFDIVDQNLEKEKESGVEGEETVSKKGSEKQAEKEEEVKEDASLDETDESKTSKEGVLDTELGAILTELVDDDVLLYDEEKDYEVSVDGIKTLVKETIEKKSKEVLDNFKKSLPEKAGELLTFLEKGGTVDDFVGMAQEVDFKKIPIEDKDGKPLEVNQIYLIQDWLEIQGYEKEEIQETIEDYRASGILQKQAEIARKKLGSWQEDKNEKLIQQREFEKLKKEEEEAKALEDFKKEVLETREIAKFPVSKQKAEKLYEYITKPVTKDGRTQFQVDDNPESRLLYAYMSMEGFDKNKLSKEIATKQSIKLHKNLSNYRDREAAPKKQGDVVNRQESSDIVKGINWII